MSHATALLNNLDLEIRDTANQVVRELKSLPESIISLTNMVQKEFGTTADKCRANAAQLRRIADDLDNRADKLEDAAPAVNQTVEEWITYENETRDAMEKLGVLLRR